MTGSPGFWAVWKLRERRWALMRAIPQEREALALREWCVSRADKNALAMLAILVPALAKAHLPEKELRARIIMLDPLVNLPESSGPANVWPALGAVVALSRDRFGMVLDAVVDLVRSGIDPRPLARWTAESCDQIGDELFRRVLEFAVRIAGMRLDLQALLAPLLELGRPQSLTPDFQALLEALEQIAGTPRQPNAAVLLKSLTQAVSGPLGRHQRSILDLTQRMLASSTSPVEALDGLAALSELDERRFAAAADFAVRMREGGLSPGPVLRQGALAAANALDWQGYLDALDAALRLAGNKVDPLPLLQLGVPLAARLSDFNAALHLIEQHMIRTNPQPHGLQAVQESRTLRELEDALHVFEFLLDRIRKAGGSAGASPGLAELSRQALSYAREYTDFTVILHPAVTHEHESYDSYYGPSYSTVVDEPERLELRPAGERRVAVSLALRSSAEIASLLAKRSWLWKSLAGPAERERVIKRGAAVREQLGTIVDGLMRSHVLVPEPRILAIYLIGSYPWSRHPNDLDLFVVLEGRQDVARFDRTRSGDLASEVSCSVVPLDVEVVGWDTLLDAVRGANVRHADVLAQGYGLLYGSVLLAGQDIHENVSLPRANLESLLTKLFTNASDAEWPELADDPEKVRIKREWRFQEAAALRRFLDQSGG